MLSWLFPRRGSVGPLSAEHAGVLARGVWQFRWLPPEHKERVREVVARMLAERRWEGGGGMAVTDEMRVTIAGVAALLTLGTDEPYAFERLPSIIVYPTAFETDQGGHLGEAWEGGPVIVSWADAARDARRAARGDNLVLHEFAHHVDGLWGEMDGHPALSRADARRWRAVVDEEHARLVGQARRGEATLLNHYGATSRAEFFAVTTECFFERSREMRAKHGDLYDLLTKFYQHDPGGWAPPPGRLAGRLDRVRAGRAAPRIGAGGLGLSPADRAFTEGLQLAEAGRHGAAVRAFDAVLNDDPDDAEARAHRAASLLELDELQAARDDAIAAAQADPDDAFAAVVAAEALLAEEDDRAAADYARRAVRLEPDNADALVVEGIAALRLGQPRRARRRLKRAVGLDPYDDEAHYWLACAYEALGDTRRAAWSHRRAEVLSGEDGRRDAPADDEPA
ncbi:M90 family metallopeptidase [Botrimarina sp.]|uniref:M90 family metallopeptidase n=1 Tax=Botrimarina sp. TaxID=2795802 RepID=UPI0032EC6482